MVKEVLKSNCNIEGKKRTISIVTYSVNVFILFFFTISSVIFVSWCISAEFCLSCGKREAATFHPLFEGGLCQTCKVIKSSIYPEVKYNIIYNNTNSNNNPSKYWHLGRLLGDVLHLRWGRLAVLLCYLLWWSRSSALCQRQLLQVSNTLANSMHDAITTSVFTCASVHVVYLFSSPGPGVFAWTALTSWSILEPQTVLDLRTLGVATCASHCCSMVSLSVAVIGTSSCRSSSLMTMCRSL